MRVKSELIKEFLKMVNDTSLKDSTKKSVKVKLKNGSVVELVMIIDEEFKDPPKLTIVSVANDSED